MAFYLWECLDKDRARTYLSNILRKDINIFKFICAIASRWTSENDVGWYFSLDKLSKYISTDIVFEKIQGISKEDLDMLTIEDQIKLASFILTYGKSESYRISELDAMTIVNDWKDNRN